MKIKMYILLFIAIFITNNNLIIAHDTVLTLSEVQKLAEEKNFAVALASIYTMQKHVNIRNLFSLFDIEQKILISAGLSVPSKWHYYQRFMLLIIPIIFLQLLIIWILFTWLIALYHRQNLYSWKRILSFFMCVFCMMMIHMQSVMLYSKRAFVIKPDTYMYAGPETTFHTIKILPIADSAMIITDQDSLYKVKYSGQVGWVQKDNVMVV